MLQHLLADRIGTNFYNTLKKRRIKLIRQNMAISMLVVQFRMARAALGLGIVEFAELASVSTNTLVRYERGEELKQSTIDHLQAVLEDAGIIFISENGDGPGIRLKKLASRNE